MRLMSNDFITDTFGCDGAICLVTWVVSYGFREGN